MHPCKTHIKIRGVQLIAVGISLLSIAVFIMHAQYTAVLGPSLQARHIMIYAVYSKRHRSPQSAYSTRHFPGGLPPKNEATSKHAHACEHQTRVIVPLNPFSFLSVYQLMHSSEQTLLCLTEESGALYRIWCLFEVSRILVAILSIRDARSSLRKLHANDGW